MEEAFNSGNRCIKAGPQDRSIMDLSTLERPKHGFWTQDSTYPLQSVSMLPLQMHIQFFNVKNTTIIYFPNVYHILLM